ncbi:MAG: 4Fe-4S binding protein [Coriobacteriales bacterium]|jgi:ferredoxin-type protein NapH|nr:4Fe-4S binding protein [Coriobacteriales bacterium]
MKSKQLRVLTALAAIALIVVGFLTNFGIGTVSAIGWADISILCPLGALGTMLASKLLVPRVLISLAIAIVLIVVLGRAFCAWACPVPLIQRIRNLFSKKPPAIELEASVPTTEAATSEIITPTDATSVADVADTTGVAGAAAATPTAIEKTTEGERGAPAPLSAEEQTALAASGCTSCAKKRSSVDARHFVLGGSLLSAAIFGFQVFCLICPIGLTFASILLVIRLFGNGDVTWSLILVPLLLIVEVVVFRKWCSKLCPLSAFMSLIGKLNRTFKPTINDATCLETAQGRSCGICGKVCPEGIDPRHPELSTASWSECTKCRECVDACPSKALHMPLFLPTAATKPKDRAMTANGSGPHE